VLVSERAALAWGALLSLIVALFEPAAALPALLVALTTSVAAATLAGRLRTRAWLLVAAMLASLAAALGLLVFNLLSGDLDLLWNLQGLAWVLGGGLVAGLLALGLLPLAETNSIGFLTEFRLLELSNPAHPLLQKLMLEAPGSYQHSLIIANLVDQAVKNIGGNALLARVGALYHDVGKTRRPQFFVENQFAGENPHDRLSPHLSFLIITSHVRDGLELLRQFKLPRALEPFVLEHHGTTVLSYFYKRALEDSSRLDELNFRYAGPRPRTKETAVLMLADAVESASRSLSEPSQGSIRALIDRLIEQRLHDDQLADSPLNFRDLEVIAGTFERMLTAILHRRISYPSPEEIKGLKHDRSSRRDPAVPAS
jgi:putative nucleotidyltransferase with HDIG domain